MSLKRTYKTHRRAFTRAMYLTLLASFGVRIYKNMHSPAVVPDPDAERKVAIDANFVRNLVRLLKIAFPRLLSCESGLVAAQALLLVVRTYLSLYVAHLDGRVTAALVRGEGRQFLLQIACWLAVGLPASTVNAGIAYVQRMLAFAVRSRLTDYAVDKYLVGGGQPVYYAVQQQQTNDTVGVNVGQLIASDTARFSNALSRLYSNLAKPLLDVTIYTWQLSQSIGGDNVFLLALTIQLSARVLRLAAPPFGEFVAVDAEREGDFRQGHSRLIEFAEEIAFYDGWVPERLSLDRSFYALVLHVDRSLRHRLAYSSLEQFVMKYWWGAAGLLTCSVPVFSSSTPENVKNRAQDFVVNRKLLLLSSDAVARIMSSYKDVSSLAGVTARVSNFLDELERLRGRSSELEVKDIDMGKGLVPSVSHRGQVDIGDYVEFDHVPIVSPSGDTLLPDLTFRIDQGQHLLIVGPNGSGKSSLFRILGGLWPLYGGKLVRPPQRDVFYIPQRPYLSRGSLRQQIIYPSSEADNTTSDSELLDILNILGIGHLVEQVGGWDARREWRDDLSMGAQQKIAAARLFSHRPKFAILDECTASVTLDTETTIYTHAQKLGITLLTVSHRASLWQYHNKILQLDGQGHYLFADLNPSERLALEEEKLKTDYQLRQIDAATERLAVLESERDKRGCAVNAA